MTASDRLRVDPAPGGVVLLQELLNSAAPPSGAWPDLLADAAAARPWLAAALQAWSAGSGQPEPRLVVDEGDLPALRDLRAELRTWLTATGGQPWRRVRLEVSVQDGGEAYRPVDGGADGLAALVGAEVLLAARAGTLARLKTCRNADCGAAFYDTSRNSSRVWHDVTTCGNVANLRASRARRRSAAAAPPA